MSDFLFFLMSFNQASETRRRGLILILSGPSGAGKSTITKEILSTDSHIDLSVSFTTRKKRFDEINGKHYHFVDKDRFNDLIEKDAFLEHAVVMNNHYGTNREMVEKSLAEGRDLIFDIDWQGHRQLLAQMKDDIVSVFVLPPAINELRNRLISRNADDSKTIEERMNSVMVEISKWAEYDYVIINDDIEKSVEKVIHILRAERLRKARRLGLPEFINCITNFDGDKRTTNLDA